MFFNPKLLGLCLKREVFYLTEVHIQTSQVLPHTGLAAWKLSPTFTSVYISRE